MPTSSDNRPKATSPPSDGAGSRLRERIRAQALSLGFDAVGFARAEVAAQARREFLSFLAEGCHGDMDWLARNAERRADPQTLWPEARSVVVLGRTTARRRTRSPCWSAGTAPRSPSTPATPTTTTS